MLGDRIQAHGWRMTRLQIGLYLAEVADLPRLRAVCQAVESSGAFDTLWIDDRRLLGPEAADAVRTSNLRLGVLLAAATLRESAPLPPHFPAPVGPVSVTVGGSGDQRLLRLVARHADMCNFSAADGVSLALIPHKVEVLKRHCSAVGRDWKEIAVTYQSVMVVAGGEAAAQEVWQTFRAQRGIPPQTPGFIGTSEQVANQVAAFLEAGMDGVIVELPEANDADRIRDAGRVLEMAVRTAQEVRR
jgi:alkanesulfonate monooxygenase SsuD/methylene tetrahydromethanopterin reductase-like flavin-dependent oxidoreductase (luciferase family)